MGVGRENFESPLARVKERKMQTEKPKLCSQPPGRNSSAIIPATEQPKCEEEVRGSGVEDLGFPK